MTFIRPEEPWQSLNDDAVQNIHDCAVKALEMRKERKLKMIMYSINPIGGILQSLMDYQEKKQKINQINNIRQWLEEE